MVTNPNTLGLFERHLPKVAEMVHAKGGLVYGDGANLNALMGRARPGDLGIDVMQFNLHKTFTTPHGGGGPGAVPVAFKSLLEPYQPGPVVKRPAAEGEPYRLDRDRPESVGRVRSFVGNFGMMVRAYTYIREMGREGLKSATDMAVLNANYLRVRLRDTYLVPFDTLCMHEVILSDKHLLARDGHEDARRGQAPHRLRLPPADRLLPAPRGRRDDGRADRDRVEGDARRVRRRDEGHRPRGARDAGAAARTRRRSRAWAGSTRREPPGSRSFAGMRRRSSPLPGARGR